MTTPDASRNEGLPIGVYDADDDLLAAGRPCVRVSQPSRIEVVLGSGSKPHLELDIRNCLDHQIVMSRRAGGGCSVVLDSGNLVVSVVLPTEKLPGIRSSFNALSAWMIAGLAACGVDGVQQRGTSDLTLDDRKIGGSCIYKPRAVLYYSTTLLVSADLALMDRYLKHPPREPDYRAGRAHREFVMNLGERGVAVESLRTQLSRVLSVPALS